MLCAVFEFGSILVTSHLMGQVAKWPCILAKWQGDLSFDRPSGEVVGRPLIWWAKWRGVQGVAPISCTNIQTGGDSIFTATRVVFFFTHILDVT